MFREDGFKPGDQRGFLGKLLGGAVKGLITGGPLGAITGGVSSVVAKRPARSTVSRTTTARPSVMSSQGKAFGRGLKFAGGAGPAGGGAGGRRGALGFVTSGTGGDILGAVERGIRLGTSRKEFAGGNGNGNGADCTWPRRWDPRTGSCRMFMGERSGPDDIAFATGDPVRGRYGVALEPGTRTIDRAVCDKGMVLGDDGLCYAKGTISNRQRMWPKGRRPLMTGGEMRAISIASAAAKRLERNKKRLEQMGMLKKPAPRRAPAREMHHHHPKAGVV